MSLDNMWKIVLGILASVGGISGLILTVIKFSSDIIADKLSKKYELRLSKELEIYKANIDNKLYISKAKFDTEFQIYRQLSKAFVNMVKENYALFPTFTKDCRDDYDTYKKFHDKSVDAIIIAQDELAANAPFIPENMYDSFSEIEKLCKEQLSDFQDFRLRPDAEAYIKDCPQEYKETYKRTKLIRDKLQLLIREVRDYLSKLDVIE